MEPAEKLLAALNELAESMPDFAAYKPGSRVHHEWLGKVYPLVAMVSKEDAIAFKVAADALGGFIHDSNLATVTGVLYRTIATVQAAIPPKPAQVFGPGAVYDFMKALRDVLGAAKASLFIVDPYMDDDVFVYLDSIAAGVTVRVLTAKQVPVVKAAITKFNSQHKAQVEGRQSNSIHDRVIFADQECWVLGQSIKDAATKKTTYLAPLAPEIAAEKLAYYETIWKSATAL
jgi:hypothetical protein